MRTLLLALLLACGGGNGATEHSAAPPPDPEPSPDPVVEPAPEPQVDPAAEPVLRVWAEPSDDGATLHVQNRGDEPVQLRSEVKLEHRSGESWEDVPIAFSLRPDCQSDVGDCVTLVPGGELIPPAWTGARGDAQCDCERCVPLEPGDVRFVIESCAPEDHVPHRVVSETLSR